MAQGKIEASGQYVINKPIVVDLLKLEIVGKVAPRTGEFSLGKATSIKYNGPAGTVDSPVYMFDCLTQSELGAAPAGRLPQSRGISVKISNFGFFGNSASMSGAPSVTNFVSAVRVRKAAFVSVNACVFGSTIYDGIVFTGPQLFTQVNDCNFYGVHRDAISVCQYNGDFSTTTWIFRNEFGYVGRYAILLNMNGSVEAMPIIKNNSIEHSFANSYYVLNRSWFVQGAVTACCFINCGNMVFSDNRCEGITDVTAGYVADIHVIASSGSAFRDSIFRKLLVSAFIGSTDELSTQAKSHLTTNGFYDITDTRNLKVGTASDFKKETESLIVENIYNLYEIIVADSRGISATGYSIINKTGAITVSLPVVGEMIDTAGSKTRFQQNNVTGFGSYVLGKQSVINTSTTTTPLQSEIHQLVGPIISAKVSAQDGDPEIQLFTEFWLRFANMNWSPKNGYKGWTLNRLAGDATQEGNYIDQPLFFALPRDSAGNVVGAGQYEAGVITKRKIRYEYTAAPASGTWKHGDICYNSYPLAGGVIGWVCVAPGTPGTWKSFGAISA